MQIKAGLGYNHYAIHEKRGGWVGVYGNWVDDDAHTTPRHAVVGRPLTGNFHLRLQLN